VERLRDLLRQHGIEPEDSLCRADFLPTAIDAAGAGNKDGVPPTGREAVMLIPFELMYRLRFAPWELRPVVPAWQRITDGPDALPPGRALDVGCGSGRDACYLAGRGWQVTGVDIVAAAIARARRRAAALGVQVRWVVGDVGALGGLGLEPGYALLYDIGCIQWLPGAGRVGAVAGMTELAAPGATALLAAFAPARPVLPLRGMSQEEVTGLFGAAWELVEAEAVTGPGVPPPVRWVRPTVYRLIRKDASGEPGT
jgi:SAM-dependent methyltransferase